MRHAYEHISVEEQERIKAEAVAEPAPVSVDDSLLAAWEADHCAHAALHAAAVEAGDEEAAARHAEAMATLDAALMAACPTCA